MPNNYCIPIEKGGTNVPAALRKLLNSNGSGGRSRTPAAQRNLSPSNNSQWKLDASTKNHNKVSCSSTGVVRDLPPNNHNKVSCCSSTGVVHNPPPTNHNKVSCSRTIIPDPPPNNSEVDSPASAESPPKNIIVNYNSLKNLIEDNLVCKHCSSASEGKRMAEFFSYSKENPDLTMEVAWQKFVRSRASFGTSSTNAAVDVKLGQETQGLATRLSLTCCRCNRKFKGHKAFCEPEKMENVDDQKRKCSQYSLNCASVIASTLNGGSHTDFQRTTKLLGLPYISFPTYKTVEEDVSKNFDITSKEAMHAALLEELELSPDFYTTENYGKLKSLTISVDMG